jgi:hypothetical protein
MKKNKTLQELFSFHGFKANKRLQGKFGDSKARIVLLTRQKKRLYVLVAGIVINPIMIIKNVKYGILMRQITECMFAMNADDYFAHGAMVCV